MRAVELALFAALVISSSGQAAVFVDVGQSFAEADGNSFSATANALSYNRHVETAPAVSYVEVDLDAVYQWDTSNSHYCTVKCSGLAYGYLDAFGTTSAPPVAKCGSSSCDFDEAVSQCYVQVCEERMNLVGTIEIPLAGYGHEEFGIGAVARATHDFNSDGDVLDAGESVTVQDFDIGLVTAGNTIDVESPSP